MFILERAWTNDYLTIGGFNNAGDVCGENDANSTNEAFLWRDGVIYDISPQNVRSDVSGYYINNMSQRHPDGSVQLVGWVNQTDGFQRAAVWTVSSTGTFSLEVLTNRILPPDSQQPGEQVSGQANSINSSGFVVGQGASYLATVGLYWEPPYGEPGTFFYSSGTTAQAVDDAGNVLLFGATFTNSDGSGRDTSAIYNGGGLTEVPGPVKAGYPVRGYDMRGQYVVGTAQFVTNAASQAFVWMMGTPSIVPLPPAPWMIPTSGEADSVSSSGDAVGSVDYYDPVQKYGGQYQMYWKNAGGAYSGYVFDALLPAEPYFSNTTSQVYQALHINDNGEVLGYFNDFGSYELRVYKPITNAFAQLTSTYYYGQKSDGIIVATVSVTRADGFTGPISVNYSTADDQGIAGQDYLAKSGTLTWAPGQSGPRDIVVPLVTNYNYEPYGPLFDLNLTSATNAVFGTSSAQLQAYDSESLVATNYNDLLDLSYDVVAGATNIVITLERQGSLDGTMVLSNLVTSDGTALAGTDYVAVTNVQPFTWAPGDNTPYYVNIPLLPPTDESSPKTFYFTLESYIDVTNAIYGYGSVTIVPPGVLQPYFINPPSYNAKAHSMSFSSVVEQGVTVSLMVSTNLKTWTSAGSVICTNGVVQFSPPVSASPPAEFFKLKIE